MDLLAKERVDVTPTQGMANIRAAGERMKAANSGRERVDAAVEGVQQGMAAAAA